MRPSSPSLPERDFTLDALNQSLRLDGREPTDMRPITIAFGPELGWVECSLGKTKYVYFCVNISDTSKTQMLIELDVLFVAFVVAVNNEGYSHR